MGRTDGSRRSFLRASAGVASVAAVAGLAGCVDAVPFVGGDGRLGAVPADADGLVYADVDRIREDDGTRTVANAYLSARAEADWYEGPESFEAAMADVEDEWDLDPTALHETVAFAAYGGDYGLVDGEYSAVVLTTDWSADGLIDAIGAGTRYREDERSGRTIYVPEEDWGSYVGVVGDSRLVVGEEAAVEDVVDTESGDADPVGGALASAYSETRAAPIRYASVVPDPDEYDGVPESIGPGGRIDIGVLGDVGTVAGSVYRDGDARGLRATFAAADVETAENLKDIVDGVLATAEGNAGDETAADLVGDVEVARSGDEVTLSIEKRVGELADLIEETTGY